MIIAATNRPDIIDAALLRPGRFDKIIEITMPNEISDRVEIFKIHIRDRPLDSKINLDELAKLTDGFSGADISAICDEAVITAIRDFVDNLDEEKMKEIESELDEEGKNSSLLFEKAFVTFDHFKQAFEHVKSSKQRLKQTQIKTEGTSTEFY